MLGSSNVVHHSTHHGPHVPLPYWTLVLRDAISTSDDEGLYASRQLETHRVVLLPLCKSQLFISSKSVFVRVCVLLRRPRLSYMWCP